jgi:hypothetical protein
LERDDSSFVGRGRAWRPDHDQQHCKLRKMSIRLLQLLKFFTLLKLRFFYYY